VQINRVETRPGVLPVIRELPARVELPKPAVSTGMRLLLADRGGKISSASSDQFVYHGLTFTRQATIDWWIREATFDELK